jgi:hypothetical protein
MQCLSLHDDELYSCPEDPHECQLDRDHDEEHRCHCGLTW